MPHLPRHTGHTSSLAGRLLRFAIPGALCALVLALTATPALAESPANSEPGQTRDGKPRFSQLDSPNWLSTLHGKDSSSNTLRIDEVYGASGGQYASDLIAVFKLQIDKLFEPGRLPFTDFFRPYVLGGKDSIQVARGGHVGRAIPGSEISTALHIGAGGDFLLSDRFVFSLDYSEVLHSGSLGGADFQTLNAGLRFLY